MKKKIDRKKLFFYIVIVIIGHIIDVTLDYYKIHITYSFGLLSLNMVLYSRSNEDGRKMEKGWELFVKFFAFILLPILASYFM